MSANTPAMITDVMVTVINPPVIMEGNILLIRYALSSSLAPSALQVDSVMIASHGNP